MKQRTIQNQTELDKAVRDLAKLEQFPYVITVTAGKKIRTSAQNARYWASLEQMMFEINQAIEMVAEHTGYTPIEVKMELSRELDPMKAAILFVRKKDSVHDIIKDICNIPTSTRLGTKEFMKFEGILDMTIAEILGDINALSRGIVS